jgi:xanthine dehydrogenase YagS FAD-binding subunit
MINFDYIRVTSPKAAVDALSKDSSAQWIAGGTNLIDLMKKGVMSPQKLIDISNLSLKGNKERRWQTTHRCHGIEQRGG